uniref:Metalloendopeptidase n=1 Tax=Parastrongyloides trichosuri TaxID=131310 RepID=A0A0N5A6R5_PARTI
MKFILFFVSLNFLSLTSYAKERKARNVVASTLRPYPTAPNYQLTYDIEQGIQATLSANIRQAVQTIQQETCLTFSEQTAGTPVDLSFVNSPTGLCDTAIGLDAPGTTRGIHLASGCTTVPEIMREIAHALGLYNEELRPDRNSYIRILYQNVLTANFSQFTIPASSKANSLNYDYGSLMHSPLNYLTSNGQNTMEPVFRKYAAVIGQRLGFSFNDLKLINMEYCSAVCATTANNCRARGYPNPRNCGVCKCPSFYTGNTCQNLITHDSRCGAQLRTLGNSRKVTFTVNGALQCLFKIRVPRGNRIVVTIERARLPGGNCFAAKGIELRMFNDKSVSGAKYCGAVDNVSLKSEMNVVLLRYNGALPRHMMRISYRRAQQ